MATSSFYNDNLFRTYPLVTTDRSLAFPRKRLVGAKVLCSFGSPYERFPTVSLAEWLVRSSEHRLTFLCTANDVQVSIPVTVPIGTGMFAQVFSEIAEETNLRITVGDLSKETKSFSSLDLPLEPTCVLWQRYRGVRSVRIGNASRDRLPQRLEFFPELEAAYADTAWWRQEIVIADVPLLFAEGYNASLIAQAVENSVRFSPQAGAGRGPTTEFISLGVTEIGGTMVHEIPSDEVAVRPDGLPDRILRSFSGASGTEIAAVANQSILVRNDVDANTVSIQGKVECFLPDQVDHATGNPTTKEPFDTLSFETRSETFRLILQSLTQPKTGEK